MHLVIFVPHAPLPDTYWIISASVRQHSTPSTQTPGIPFKKQICTSFWHLAFAYSFNDVFCRSLNHLYFIYVNRVRERAGSRAVRVHAQLMPFMKDTQHTLPHILCMCIVQAQIAITSLDSGKNENISLFFFLFLSQFRSVCFKLCVISYIYWWTHNDKLLQAFQQVNVYNADLTIIFEFLCMPLCIVCWQRSICIWSRQQNMLQLPEPLNRL